MEPAKILVVEDEMIVAMDIQSALRNLGHIIAGSAATGQEAIRLARVSRPDLVLMDIKLKGEMTGIQAADVIRTQENLPVVFLTAFTDTGTLNSAALAQPFGYIVKPFDGKELDSAIAMALYRHRLEGKLKESEEKHRNLFETMADGVVYQSADGRITSANPAAEEILGLKLDQMLGRTSIDSGWRAIHPDGSDFPGEEHPAMVALRSGQPVRNVQMGVFHPQEDRWRWILISAIPQFRVGESQAYQVYATFSDITGLVLAEQALARQVKIEKVVAEITSAFAGQTELAAAIHIALEKLGHLYQADRVGLILHNPAEEVVKRVYEWQSGTLEGDLQALLATRYEQFPWLSTTLAAPQTLIIEDCRNLPIEADREKSLMESLGIRSALMIAFSITETQEGALALISSLPRCWEDIEHSLLDVTTRVISGAVQKAMAQEAEQRARNQTETLREALQALTAELNLNQIIELLLSNLARVLPFDAAIALLYDNNGRLQVEAGQGDFDRVKMEAVCLKAECALINDLRNSPEAVILSAFDNTPRAHCLTGAGQFLSGVGTRMAARGRVHGYLLALSKQVGIYDAPLARLAQTFSDQAALAIENARLYEQAYHHSITDPLTELYNRRRFLDLADSEIERVKRHETPLSVIVMDMDHFKAINDIYGHAAGDRVLVETARRMRAKLRSVDVLARFGGEEFIVMLPATPLEQAAQAAERLRLAICEQHIAAEGTVIAASGSFGVAQFDSDCQDLHTLLTHADRAMYAAKAAGRNQVKTWSQS
jgi:diguanylate cyclase (GGDEF)-like protein/PAS domain S-box-containing protein